MNTNNLISSLNSELETLQQVREFSQAKTFMGHNTTKLIAAYKMIISSQIRQRATTEIIKHRI